MRPVTRADGVLISLEGCDGCGKSTQARLLCEYLLEHGLPVGPAANPGAVVREPGGTPVGEAIRDVLLHGRLHPAPWTEALLYAAARAELVETVLVPELANGRILVLDRFVDSSLAYQGYARGLGIDEVMAVNEPSLYERMPDLTVVLALDPVLSMSRLSSSPDRIEAQGLAFQRRVAVGYEHVARRFPERVRIVDAARGIDTVAREIADLALARIEASARGVA